MAFLVLVEAQDLAFVNPWLEPAQLSTQHRARLSNPSCELTRQYKKKALMFDAACYIHLPLADILVLMNPGDLLEAPKDHLQTGRSFLAPTDSAVLLLLPKAALRLSDFPLP